MEQYHLEPANHADYRDFLNKRFSDLKSQNKNFSLQSCAKRSKLSKSLLQFLFRKRRHISLDKLPGLAKALKLTSEEEYFVYLLVCKNSSRNPTIQMHFENILNRVRHEYVQVKEAEPTTSQTRDKDLYLDHLFMVLQTLVRLEGFREDPKWILSQLTIKGLSEEKIVAALTELERLGYLYRDENSRLQAKPEALWRPDPYDPNGQKVFTKAAEAVASLMQHPEIYRPSVYMSLSLAMDEPHLLEAEKFMIEVHHRLLAMSNESKHPTAAAFFGNFFLTLARLQK